MPKAADTTAVVPLTGSRSLPVSAVPTVSPSAAQILAHLGDLGRAGPELGRVLGRAEVVAVVGRAGGGHGRHRLRQARSVLTGQDHVEVEDLPRGRRPEGLRPGGDLGRRLG